MIIERFKGGDPGAVGDRFQERGRLLPDGVEYMTSWMTPDGDRCFQVMKAPSEKDLGPWIRAWDDLVDFEVIPVVTSREYWSERTSGP